MTDIDGMADAIMRGLEEYADLTADEVKKAVKSAGNTVRKEISENAPKRTGDYARSWAVKKVKETAESLDLVVYSKTGYRIAHLLEFGHAKRGGGRVRAIPHIAPAEKKGREELEKDLKGL